MEKHAGKTKDERYLLSLHTHTLNALNAASDESEEKNPAFSRYEIGEIAHLSPKAVDTICKLLLQANFIVKSGEKDIRITPHGQKLAEKLLEE